MTPRKRVAVIAWGEVGEIPSATDGNQPRKFSVVRHLAKEHDVTFVSLALEGETRRVDLPEGVDLVEVTVPTSTLSTRANVRATMATLARRDVEHDWQRTVVAALADRDVEVVVTMWMVRLPWLSRHVPTITFLEEDMRRQPENPSSFLYRAKQAVDTWAVDRGLAGCAAAVVISPRELDWARKRLPKVPVRVVPHWVNEEYWSGVARTTVDRRQIAVVGQMSLERNARGLRDIANALMEHPADERPCLVVASASEPHPCLQGLPTDVLRFIGRVDDARELYATSAATLVPSFLVMGSKTTILQAWAAGVPVVTTTAAADSVEAEDGVSVRSAPDPTGVALALVEVAADPALGDRLAQAGRAQLRENHSLEAVGRVLDEMVGSAAVRHAERARTGLLRFRS